MLPKDYEARKALPVYDFLTGYFPDAIIELVKVSVAGNHQHNPGEKLHWARGKSMDQLNTAMRHILDHGMGSTYDTEPPEVLCMIGDEGTMHLAKAAWRLLAEIQLICEARANGTNYLLTEPSIPRPGGTGHSTRPTVEWASGAPYGAGDPVMRPDFHCPMCGATGRHERWCEHHKATPNI